MQVLRTRKLAAAVVVVGVVGVTGAVASPALATTHPSTTVTAGGQKTIWYGTTGATVRLAQTKLNSHGARLVVDGVFGKKTLAAVRAFQAAQMIRADGVVGPVTWSRLNASSTKVPTLGLAGWAPGTRGYGASKPNVIDNNGDPTGTVTGVTWRSWGGATASGSGTGYWPGDGPVVDAVKAGAEIRAYDLTTCDGHPAYRKVVWWFPSKGETFESTQHQEPYDICYGS